jgi:sugar phosphate isomerase/epimerase
MKIGVSTASLYPMHTEKALLETARLGVKQVEIFLNSYSELEGEVFLSMQNTISEYGVQVMAVHPFSSPQETLMLFSSYDRRVNDIMDLYKKHFEMMNKLCSKSLENPMIFVIHGVISSGKCSDERYIERFSRLCEAGKAMGITVAQENVSYCRSGNVGFLEMLSREMGESAKFVLDVKQARRSGVCPFDIIDRVGDKIVHLHLSDADYQRDCLPVGEGNFNFAELFFRLNKIDYKGGAVVELYRENYREYKNLVNCVEKLENLQKSLDF